MTDMQRNIAEAKTIAEQLLPRDSSTDRERAVLTAEIAIMLGKVPEIIETIYDPWRCPEQWLPWLAWFASVDVWDDAWSVIEKRREIAASPVIHRLKGARGSIKRALDRLGLDYEITHWGEVSPQRTRGTFKVFVTVSDEPTLPIRELARARIRASKPKSRTLDLKIGVQETGPIGIAAATITRSTLTADVFLIDGPAEETGPIGIASATVTRSIITAEAA